MLDTAFAAAVIPWRCCKLGTGQLIEMWHENSTLVTFRTEGKLKGKPPPLGTNHYQHGRYCSLGPTLEAPSLHFAIAFPCRLVWTIHPLHT